MAEGTQRSLVLFDGLCNLCNGAVNFIIDRDPGARLAFAPLQSPTGLSTLHQLGFPTDVLSSVVLVENGKSYTRSTAALRIARHLGGLWPLIFVLVLIPRPLRDLIYDWIARNRYRWFGRRDSCRMPSPEIAGRFMDGDFAAKGEMKTASSKPRST